MDLESWLTSLPTDDRLLLALRQAGHTLTEISTATGRSITAVRVHLLALGRELAERAGVELDTAA
jgi:DNA-directed RNA polymerase specialized sigma24 family protein